MHACLHHPAQSGAISSNLVSDRVCEANCFLVDCAQVKAKLVIGERVIWEEPRQRAVQGNFWYLWSAHCGDELYNKTYVHQEMLISRASATCMQVRANVVRCPQVRYVSERM